MNEKIKKISPAICYDVFLRYYRLLACLHHTYIQSMQNISQTKEYIILFAHKLITGMSLGEIIFS